MHATLPLLILRTLIQNETKCKMFLWTSFADPLVKLSLTVLTEVDLKKVHDKTFHCFTSLLRRFTSQQELTAEKFWCISLLRSFSAHTAVDGFAWIKFNFWHIFHSLYDAGLAMKIVPHLKTFTIQGQFCKCSINKLRNTKKKRNLFANSDTTES